MCVVIDVNTFPDVFATVAGVENDFSPVLGWIKKEESGRMVFGGTKYKKELSKMSKYFGVILELKKIRKVAQINDILVDKREAELKKLVNKDDFDDPHIIAILTVSGCRVFCSKDKRSDKFLKDKILYPKGHARPSIYRSKRNIRLLNNNMLVTLKNCI